MKHFCSLHLVVFASTFMVNCKAKRDTDIPTLTEMGGFSLVNQDGQRVTEKSFSGQVWAASFIFTRCPTVCPRMMTYTRALQSEAQEHKVALHFVSFSVDPDNDTPAVLKEYSKKYHADLATWTFLTGDFDDVKKTSVDGFRLSLEGSADANQADFGILHSSYLVLVDKKSRIRGYYPTKDPKTRQKILQDAASLISD